MNAGEYNGGVTPYLRTPLYMIIVFAAGAGFLCWYDPTVGIISVLIVIVYAMVSVGLYRRNARMLSEEMTSLATDYASMQKQFLEHFELPYAILDTEGRFLWQNEKFCGLTGKEKTYSKSVTSIFPEVTREWLDREEGTDFDAVVMKDDRSYRALFSRVHLGDDTVDEPEGAKPMIRRREDPSALYTMLLLDITESEQIRQQNEDQRMCCALLYIDNYEDTIAEIEAVKRSLLTAVIDRKVTRYFQEADAIIRKSDRDKYFIIFQYRYLSKLEENKFSILEDIKSTKLGNDTDLTISMGIGVNGATYRKNAEFARTAIDIAMGRGGSQVVIKDNGNISYYGVRGKEVEKNTRVKARAKAEALRELIGSRDRVLVMGHQISDIDAVGAGIGVYCAARELEKECHIVLNTINTSLRPILDLFTPDHGYPPDLFVNSDQALSLLTANTLVMVVDTNRPSYTECPELLEKSKSIVVIDHHRQGGEKVENPILSYIEPYASSTCEMIAEILQYFSENIKLQAAEADAIYAGILIDTDNFMTKTGVRTFEAAAYLKRSGSDVIRVRKLLRENMDAYKARAEIVRDSTVYRDNFAISVNRAEGIESPTIVGAQAANELLNIVGIKASFVLTLYKGKIYVSSRSIDEIDVQQIMERLGGGGHLNIAGAQIENATTEDVIRKIENIIDVMIEEGTIKLKEKS
ncbi:MAG: DHH family phosphoesterase [Lachnospiraceae bacterium]|nr:DHH family phosphoesterase [Lachnospiraceae bacterium]